MGAIIVPFETRAEREERLCCALMVAYEAHQAGETPATFDTLVQALNRLVAFQLRKPEAQASHQRPYMAAQGGSDEAR